MRSIASGFYKTSAPRTKTMKEHQTLPNKQDAPEGLSASVCSVSVWYDPFIPGMDSYQQLMKHGQGFPPLPDLCWRCKGHGTRWCNSGNLDGKRVLWTCPECNGAGRLSQNVEVSHERGG